MKPMACAAGIAFLSLVSTSAARADEGMWTLDNLPVKQLQTRYGFTPTAQWIDHLMHASARLTLGCSASFVSADGLVMTNHHCADECLSDLSGGHADYMQDGFVARDQASERRCPGMELNQLSAITDVTPQIDAATKNKTGADYIRAQHAAQAEIERDCAGGDAAHTRCDVISLYEGGRYALYRYRRFDDVHLVFAPDQNIAAFGGDPDNFNFPRYDLDVTFLRAYENGKPVHTDFLPFDPRGPKAGELVVTSGNPGSTARETTAAQLRFMHDVTLPAALDNYENMHGVLWEWSRESALHRKEAADLLLGVENTLKVYNGREDALGQADTLARKDAAEKSLLDWIDADPARRATYGNPFAAIAATLGREGELYPAFSMLEGTRAPAAFDGDEFRFARLLVRAAAERTRPDAQRLPAYRDANLPAIEEALFSSAAIYPDFNETLLGLSLTRMRQVLGADDANTRLILGKASPEELAHHLIGDTTLRDISVRRALWNGGARAIEASNDPMIRFARLVDPASRAVRTAWENEVEAPQHKAGALIARARFARDGTSMAPDATFTERLSFGTVAGWNENGKDVAPFTNFAGLYDRTTGRTPFDLTPLWTKAAHHLDLQTPFDFVSTNDITGGNSGSPVIDRDGHVVGLAFDGNIRSIAGTFFYDPSVNRTVSVDTAALLAALRNVYGDDRLAGELVGKRG